MEIRLDDREIALIVAALSSLARSAGSSDFFRELDLLANRFLEPALNENVE